ncbi:KdsC family phosphatase [Desulfobacula phenolica]|uniref:3-deoxy-D-manno-octulosonate 8-phosphate phosphatase KdsC n=1 Tax=Desulfobacula phenolica TaxID=90732 RepID=A0A1H2EW66_9BACT|nr:HAD-IIIA family hydrolase [Desulfobacula phenolica]SDT99344.1 3-deoxy-D-manno-octulosonate 8-phosphate phosphatase (KDO 8-P phosphatase) [Desulfobacula phenolica]
MKTKLANIDLLLLDVDGVLTDGSITYSDSGEQIKSFHSRDGLGLRLLMDAGIGVGIITGRKSKALEYRCENLGITLLFDGIKDKSKALDTITARTGTAPEKIAFVGDDLIDLPVMKRVGLSFCVPEAPEEVKIHSDIITIQKGGQGAVREICDNILKAKGLWDIILNQYLL